MFGSFHIEHCVLIMHGEIIRGSGLFEILNNNEFSILALVLLLMQSFFCSAIFSSAFISTLKVVVCLFVKQIPPMYQWWK